MTAQSFWRSMAIVTAATALLLFGLQQLPLFASHALFAWLGLLLYAGLGLLAWYMGKQTAASANPNAFIQFFMGFVGAKMFLTIILLVVYVKSVGAVENKYFVLPFLLTYLIYTVYESWFLMKLAKPRSAEG